MNTTKTKKPRMKFTAFLRKYGRILIGGLIIATVVFCVAAAPLLTEYDPEAIAEDINDFKQPPSKEHWLGTDIYGHDMWSRIIYGGRTTLLVSVGAQVVLVVLGTVLGLLCGYYTKVEKYLMRFLEAVATIPSLLFTMLMISVFGNGIPQMIIAMSLFGVPGLARMIRNQVLSLREKEYIESEKAMGASDLRTVFLHILPACASYLLVRFSNGLSGMILSMTSLTFLGIGLDPTTASWGGLVNDGQRIMFAVPHVITIPTFVISITVFGFVMLGDGLRDLFDPRLK